MSFRESHAFRCYKHDKYYKPNASVTVIVGYPTECVRHAPRQRHRSTRWRRWIFRVGYPNAKRVRVLRPTQHRGREDRQAVTWRHHRSRLEEDERECMGIHNSLHCRQPCNEDFSFTRCQRGLGLPCRRILAGQLDFRCRLVLAVDASDASRWKRLRPHSKVPKSRLLPCQCKLCSSRVNCRCHPPFDSAIRHGIPNPGVTLSRELSF